MKEKIKSETIPEKLLKTYKIPVTWMMCGDVHVEARNLQEAVNMALGPETELPKGDYLADSEMIDDDIIKGNYPNEEY